PLHDALPISPLAACRQRPIAHSTAVTPGRHGGGPDSDRGQPSARPCRRWRWRAVVADIVAGGAGPGLTRVHPTAISGWVAPASVTSCAPAGNVAARHRTISAHRGRPASEYPS